MVDMNKYVKSNFYRGDDLELNVHYEEIVSSVDFRDFEDTGEVTPILCFESGKKCGLNQTRLTAMIDAYGPNSDNWIGKKVIIFRSTATYQGKPVAAVGLEPVVATRIAAEPAGPRLVKTAETAPAHDRHDGSYDPEDDIPF
jgi:hypothetical protein